MSLWLVRAGKYGEHENKFIDENRVFLTWGDVSEKDLTKIPDYEGIKRHVQEKYAGDTAGRIGNYSGQIWAFVLAMKVGDLVVLPRKGTSTIAIGEIKSECRYDPSVVADYRHFHEVSWLNTEIPRSAFDQDLLYSFGAFLTVCEIKRNDAEKRVRTMSLKGWNSSTVISSLPQPDRGASDIEQPHAEIDLEEVGLDSIANLIIQKFKGHGMALLVDAILKAQGFTTHLSPEGPDKGIDILAGRGAFGFESPKICVQVKSGDAVADRPEFTQLIGAMQSVNADFGLFVSWSGFKHTVYKEVPNQFFKVRLWNRKDLIEQLLSNYDKLDQDIRAEIPLKQVWTIATPDIE